MLISRLFISLCLLSKGHGFINPPARHKISRSIHTRTYGNPVIIDENKAIQLKNKLPSENLGNLLDHVDKNMIKEIIISQDLKLIISFDHDGNIKKTDIHPLLSPDLIRHAQEHHTDIKILPESGRITILQRFLSIPFFYLGFRLLKSIVENTPFAPTKDFSQSLFIKPNVTLHDWAGSPEIFEECFEIVSYLKNSSRYQRVGAQIPKGILLEGLPGTGKTLLAKAIAHETDAHFISIVGSDFVELFVGMGASRVRKLFQEARKKKPTIIFIDEIDAIGRKRSSTENVGNNEEREQTLNQLLAEMDGFSSNDRIIVIGATNRKDILDNALLRPGRFDRIINVPLPDAPSRRSILNLYLKKYRHDTIDLDPIVSLTAGLSGAQLKNILNEAAILAARCDQDKITNQDILAALEKIQIGVIKKTDVRDRSTRERIAIHEVGHTMAVLLFAEYFEFEKTTIQATYSGAGGYTLFREKEHIADNGLYTKDMLMKRLMIMLAGKAAENVIYSAKFVSVGAYQDLKDANRLARQMIREFGMGVRLEVFSDLQDTISSEYIRGTADKECMHLIDTAFRTITEYLEHNIEFFESIRKLLLEKNTITKEDLALLQQNGE